MTTYEKIVKGATKVKLAAPKPKYIEPILMATSIDHPSDSENFHVIMKNLQYRMQDSAWSVVYKSFIVLHIMIREGDKDVTLNYLVRHPHAISMNHSSITQNHNLNSDVRFITRYAKYFQVRVKQYESTGIDYVRDERSNNSSSQQGGRLRSLTVEKGLLRETESVQKQIDALLKNYFVENEVNNDVILTAFRLLVNDLLALFQELNEGVINLLEHYFEMSKVDAERALKIYKKFVDQTKYVIDYLRVAKHLEYATKLHVPTIKHAPTALTSSLEEYLDDPDFETNRRQYLEEKSDGRSKAFEGKSNIKKNNPLVEKPHISKVAQNSPVQSNNQRQIQNDMQNVSDAPAPIQRSGTLLVRQSSFNPWASSINPGQAQPLQGVFYVPTEIPQHTVLASIDESGQQTGIVPVNGQLYQGVMAAPQNNPMGVASMATGSGFGGSGSPYPLATQNTQSQFVTQQVTNPQSLQYQSTNYQMNNLNPFIQPSMTGNLVTQNTSPNAGSNYNLNSNTAFVNTSSQPTGHLVQQNTNPFANSRFSQSATMPSLQSNQPPIAQQLTNGNPFKVSAATSQLFSSAAAAQPTVAQHIKQQPTAGGLENVPTISVFPETRKEAEQQFYLNQARTGIQQGMAGALNSQTTQQAWGSQAQSNPFLQNNNIPQQHNSSYVPYNGPSLI